MPDYLSQDPSIFGTLGGSISDEAGLFLGDPFADLLSSLHEGVGESRFAVDINADGLRTHETGLEAWLKWLREQQQEENSTIGSSIGNDYDSVTGIPPSPPSVPVVNSGASHITGVDEPGEQNAEIEGVSAAIEPAPMRLESETMELSGGYSIETKEFASGEALIGLKNRRGNSGSAQSTFTGASGTYAVIVGYYDESDGESTMSLELGEHQFEWVLNEQLKAQKASSKNLVRRVISSGITLNPGDAVTLNGNRDRGEMARVDYHRICASGPDSTPAIPCRGRRASPGKL